MARRPFDIRNLDFLQVDCEVDLGYGPEDISSTFPTGVLFSRYIGALKYGIFSLTDMHINSSSCRTVVLLGIVSRWLL